MSKNMSKVIIYPDDIPYLKECIAFARKNGNISLIRCIQGKRRQWNWQDVELRLYQDRNKYSLYFDLWNKKENRRIYNGGIIYHGKHDAFGAGGIANHVTLSPTQGWSTHT
jgi:Domain of unknown function (DUF4120)